LGEGRGDGQRERWIEGRRVGRIEGGREVGEEEVKEWETGSDHERGGEKDRRRERTVRCGE